MSERQLHLFKGKRQKGEGPPSPSEFELHVALADLLRRWCHPNWMWFHVPNGERRDEVTAARLKRMGVRPGVSDFIFIGPGPTLFFLELKRAGGKPSEAQKDFAAHVCACGCSYLMTSDLTDAIGTLRDLGIVRASVSA